MTKPSLFFSCLRAFCLTIVISLGIALGFFILGVAISSITSLAEDEIGQVTSQTILPDANGVRKVMSKKTPVILQVDIVGAIGGKELNTARVRTQLLESREGDFKDNRVKAVLLNIMSPGGSIFDSDSIFQAIHDYREKYNVPVYAFVDGMCLSGGMYVAMAADKVYATDVSLVGSIGVLFLTSFNVTETMQKLGIKSATFTAGKGKDPLNPFRPWAENEGENIGAIVDSYYQKFVNHVVKYRPEITKEQLVDIYGAKVFTAEEGVEFGMIDGIRTSRESVLSELAKKAGLEKYQVVRLERKNVLKQLFEAKAEVFQGTFKHEIYLGSDPCAELKTPFLYLFHPQ